MLVRLQVVHPARQVAVGGKLVQVTENHARHEQRAEPAIGDVQEVVDETNFAQQAGIPRATREGHEHGVNDDGTPELHRDRPGVEIVGKPRLAAGAEDEGKVLELGVPIPHLPTIGALGVGHGMDMKHMQEGDVGKGGADDGEVQSEPSTEESRRQVIS